MLHRTHSFASSACSGCPKASRNGRRRRPRMVSRNTARPVVWICVHSGASGRCSQAWRGMFRPGAASHRQSLRAQSWGPVPPACPDAVQDSLAVPFSHGTGRRLWAAARASALQGSPLSTAVTRAGFVGRSGVCQALATVVGSEQLEVTAPLPSIHTAAGVSSPPTRSPFESPLSLPFHPFHPKVS